MNRNTRGQVIFKRSQSLKKGANDKYSLYGSERGGDYERLSDGEGEGRRDAERREVNAYVDDVANEHRVGIDFTKVGVKSVDGRSTSACVQAIADIFITTVGAGIFALPKSMLSIGIMAGTALVLVASVLSLFTHYAILYAHSYADEGDGKEPYTAVIDKFLPSKVVQAIYAVIFWILIAISCVAYYSVLKSYYISFFGEPESDIEFFAIRNPNLWVSVIAVLAAIWAILKYYCGIIKKEIEAGQITDSKVESRQKCFESTEKSISLLSAILTIVSSFGALAYFLIQGIASQRSVDDVLYPAPIPEYVQPHQSTWYSFLMFLGASIPTLCMSFLNHTNTAEILQKQNLPARGGKRNRSICCSRQFGAILITQGLITVLYILVPAFALWAQGSNVNQKAGNILIVMTSQITDHSSPYWIAGIIFQFCSALGIVGALFNIYLPTLLTRTLNLPSILLECFREILFCIVAKCPCCSCLVSCSCCRNDDYKPIENNESRCDKCWKAFHDTFKAPIMATVLSIACLVVAVVAKEGLDLFMSLGGSLSASAIMFIFPSLACFFALLKQLRQMRASEQDKNKPKCWYNIMIILCLVTALAGLMFAVFGTCWIFHAGLPTPPKNETLITSPTNGTLIIPLVPGTPNLNSSIQWSS